MSDLGYFGHVGKENLPFFSRGEKMVSMGLGREIEADGFIEMLESLALSEQ